MSSKAQLASNLKQYTYNVIGTQWQAEIRQQFDAWIGPGSFVTNVGDAIDKATANQISVLQKSEQNQRESYERSMFIFSLFAPVALSWMAGTIQYIVGPQLFRRNTDAWRVVGGDRIYVAAGLNTSQVKSKMLADVGMELVSRGFPLLIIPKNPTPDVLKPNGLAASQNGITLRTNIEIDIKAQRDAIITELMAISQNINNSIHFGDLIVAKYIASNTAAKNASPATLEISCRQMVNEIVNSSRTRLADKYPIYGMNPPNTPTSKLIKIFESHMWALWLNQNNFRAWARYTNDYRPSIGPGVTGEFLPKDIALHILDNFTGMHELMLQYNGVERFTLGAIESLIEWAKQKLQTSPLNQLSGGRRALRPIESYFG